jgi:hypothetical protein
LSPTIDTLIAARTLHGIGGGIAVPLALALITDTTPPDKRGQGTRYLGVPSPVSPSQRARSSAEQSWKASRGNGCSGSTSH